MKTILNFLAPLTLVLLIAACPQNLLAQNPEYRLEITGCNVDDCILTPYFDWIEFDIKMTWINPGSVPEYQYAGGQYFLNFFYDNWIGNYGNFSFDYSPVDSSDLPESMRPRNPQMVPNFDSTIWQLRMAVNVFPGAGNGYFMPPGIPVRIAKMRITGENRFSCLNDTLHLEWRNGPANPYTKIFAYVNSVNTEISTPETHLLNYDCLILPVELTDFAATVNQNLVTLVWTTTDETLNRGFEIERSAVQTKNWKKVGAVQGMGTSSEPKSYLFTETVATGIYNYRLKQIDFNGNFEYFELPEAVTIGVPDKYFVDQNYPNPFNPLTTIAYGIPQSGNVTLKIFDMAGREIKTLVNEFRDAGYYVAKIDGSSLASGTYIYHIESGSFVSAKKMVMLK